MCVRNESPRLEGRVDKFFRIRHIVNPVASLPPALEYFSMNVLPPDKNPGKKLWLCSYLVSWWICEIVCLSHGLQLARIMSKDGTSAVSAQSSLSAPRITIIQTADCMLFHTLRKNSTIILRYCSPELECKAVKPIPSITKENAHMRVNSLSIIVHAVQQMQEIMIFNTTAFFLG